MGYPYLIIPQLIISSPVLNHWEIQLRIKGESRHEAWVEKALRSQITVSPKAPEGALPKVGRSWLVVQVM